MKKVCARLAGAILILATSHAALAGDSVARQRFEGCRAIFESIAPQIAAERAAFLEDLSTGAAAGLWTIDEKDKAGQRLQGIVQTAEEDALLAPQTGQTPQRPEILQIELHQDALEMTGFDNPAIQRFAWQLRQLDAMRRGIAVAVRAAACDYAEEIWLGAKKVSDLEPAVRALSTARAASDVNDWRAVFAARSAASRGGGASIPLGGHDDAKWVEDAFDMMSVIGSPEPLLLPDPAVDPAAFIAARADWLALEKIGSRFVRRPAIAARFAELDERFRLELAAARRALADGMLHRISAEKFGGLIKRFSALDARPVPRSAQQNSPGSRSNAPNYLDFIIPWPPNSPPVQRQPARRPEMAAYEWWRDSLSREKPEGDEAARKRGSELRMALAPLPPGLVEQLAKSLSDGAKPAIAAPPADAPANPIAALIAALRKDASSKKDENRGAELKPLISALERCASGEVARLIDDRGFDSTWAALAKKEKGIALIGLRDRAAEYLLAAIPASTPPSGAPLETHLRERLDTALKNSAFDIADRLLAMDGVCGVLAPTERASFQRAVEVLRSANASDAAGNRDKARQTYLGLIAATDLPEAGEIAAHFAKRIPHK